MCTTRNRLAYHTWEAQHSISFYISYGDLVLTPVVLGLDSRQQCFLSTSCVSGTVLGTWEEPQIKMNKKALAVKELIILREKKKVCLSTYRYRECFVVQVLYFSTVAY